MILNIQMSFFPPTLEHVNLIKIQIGFKTVIYVVHTFLLCVFADIADSPTSSKPDLSACSSSPPSPQHSSSSCGPLSPPQARVSFNTHPSQTRGKLYTLASGLCSNIGSNTFSLICSRMPIEVS